MDFEAAFEAVSEAPAGGEADAEPTFETPAESRQGMRSWLEERGGAERRFDGEPVDVEVAPPEHVEPSELAAARREAAEHRRVAEQYAPIAERLDRLSDEGREGLLYLAELYTVNPERAAYELAQSFGLDVTGIDEPSVTPADIEHMLDQREAEYALEEATAEARTGLQGTARELGYEPGSDGYQTLLAVAHGQFMFDEHGGRREPEEAMELAHRALTRRASPASPPAETGDFSRRDARAALSAALG